jgi:hypothetical protein
MILNTSLASNHTSVYNTISEAVYLFKQRVEASGGVVESDRCLDRQLKRLGLENLQHQEIAADFNERLVNEGAQVEGIECLEKSVFNLLHI